MKKCCKSINITNPETIAPFIADCLRRHKRRRDFKREILQNGTTTEEYEKLLEGASIDDVAMLFAKQIAHAIKTHNIPKFKVRASEKYDAVSEKTRLIGNESCLQRLYDYVAVYSCMELWERKMVGQQCSSMVGRGQLYGVRMIQRYTRKNNCHIDYCKRHGIKYTDKMRYFVKLDIYHCFSSMDRELIKQRLSHDVGNNDLLYLWGVLLDSYAPVTDGILIGALPSQWISQYMLSSLYRQAMAGGGVSYMIMYMDDMLLFSHSKSKLKKAVLSLCEYAKNELHLTVKPNWHIKRYDVEPIDMMGYVIHRNGKIRIRAKTFIHARRMALRIKRTAFATLTQAQRLVSYKGCFLHSDCHKAWQKYNLEKAFASAQNVVSNHERSKTHVSLLRQRTRKD